MPTIRNSIAQEASEYRRPWKLTLLALGIVTLIVGARTTGIRDWDVPFSIIMAIATYFTAPWAVRAMLRKDDAPQVMLALCIFLAATAGLYTLYWFNVSPQVFKSMYADAIPAIIGLYLMCGFIWLHAGPLETHVSPRGSRMG